MTVAELIKDLQEIENKNLEIYAYNNEIDRWDYNVSHFVMPKLNENSRSFEREAFFNKDADIFVFNIG